MKSKNIARYLGVALGLLLSTTAFGAESKTAWWQEAYPKSFDASSLPSNLDFIRVEGHRFVDEDGKEVTFRGVSIADPDKLARSGHWSRDHFETVASWGANLIRLPVHPAAWRERGKKDYFELLDEAVVWATELGLYLMIDWHSIGNLQSGLFQHPMYDTTRQETLSFWRSVSGRYAGIPAIAFYEIFNEPTTYQGQLGLASWSEWKRFNEEAISIIYAHDRQVIPLVAGFDWAYRLEEVATEPIAAQGIGYVSHPYPQKVEPPYVEKWEADFGFVADRYPLFVTEFGFMSADSPGAHAPTIADEDYGRAILAYLDGKGASWAAWCFDPDWPPQLVSDWSYTPTTSGKFFREQMRLAAEREPAIAD
jgi:hypothetical protein